MLKRFTYEVMKMFCVNCGANLPDDAKFCSKCGKPMAQASPAPQAAPQAGGNAQELDQLHQSVKAGLEYTGQAMNILREYDKLGRDIWLQKAEDLLNRSMVLLAQIGELNMVKGLTPEGRMDLMTREFEYQRLIVRTTTGMAEVDYFRKRWAQAVERIHRLITETLPKNSVFINELTPIRQQYLDKLRSKDFNQWRTVRKDVMKDEVRPEELSFTEKMFS